MSSAIEQLHALLLEDEERRQKEEAERSKRRAALAPLLQAIESKIYNRHGIRLPVTGSWSRPIPSNLYRCPISAPQTTLMPWSLLPHAVRLKLKAPDDSEHDVVEVPLAYLSPPQAEDLSSLQRRPLGGNLTNKLSEYTRGRVGQCRPFRAGGLDESDIQKESADEDQQLLEEVLQAKEVLEKGSAASWRDGTLLTAPPGAGFKIGLGWKHVYKDDVAKGEDAIVNQGRTDDIDVSRSEQTSMIPAESRSKPSTLWNKPFFEDDSLFGDSSDSEEDESLEDQVDDDMLEQDTEPTKEESLPEILSGIHEIDLAAGTPDEVDHLLAELSLPGNEPIKKRSQAKQVAANPLRLAEEQSQLAQQATRKSWADTRLLPISDFNSYIPNPAMRFPFQLDSFQQQAVARLERGESIFVAAHTSAGKTVCAEYAVALSQQHCSRTIYTSPIKALSNQKFRDFCTKFGSENVGLLTGDIQVNVDNATIVIMTTEILRSMLYRGADMIRDIEFVIFDEVHYVNDTERGVVWEEVIIMLPQYVNMIFLSATTPNTIEFSDWIGRTKRKVIHVIRTNYRPVPLSHFLWAGLKLHKIMEGKSGFLEKGYKESVLALQPSTATKKGQPEKGSSSKRSSVGAKHMAWQAQGNKQNWQSLVKFLEREGLTPTVVFSFSKKKCEEIAHMLRSLDLNTGAERSAVHAFTVQTVARLSPADGTLPQVLAVCEMSKRGIAIHHGGLLPILKEMVEILFSRNLIKVLFATETFAMGVNMPARAVVFNSIRKHDGTQFRVLEPGEYTQMAGRAGRRGLDKVGTVIMCCFGEEPPPLPILRHMLTGSSTKLSSQFRLTYNMIMNLLRVEDMSVESMIKRSFSEFATQRALTANEYPNLLERGEKTLIKLDEQFRQGTSTRIGAEDLEDYFSVCSELLALNSKLLAYILESVGGQVADVLQTGRIVLVTAARKHGCVRVPAMVLQPPSVLGSDPGSASRPAVCIVLLPESYVSSSASSEQSPQPGTINFVGESKHRHYAIHQIVLDEILVVSANKHKVDADAIFKEKPSARIGDSLASRLDAFPGGAVAVSRKGMTDSDLFMGVKPRSKNDIESSSHLKGRKGTSAEDQAIEKAIGYLIDTEAKERSSSLKVMDMRNSVKQGSEVIEFRKCCSQVEDLVDRMRSFASHQHPNIEGYYATLERKETLRSRVNALRHLLSNESLQLFPDFLQRKALLSTLGYIDDNETVCIKGRVACEVNTCEELIVTEMVFEGILNELEPAEIVAALSALIFQEKQSEEEFDSELPEQLISCCECMKKIATNLGQLQKDHGLDVDPGEYCDASKFGLVHVVYEWALGVPFKSICDLTLVQEGSIVRCITRLDELIREVRNCAKVVGNPSLYRKMEAASIAIKRDIVFASSLYVS